MASKMKVDSPQSMSVGELKEKLVTVFREVFDEAVDNGDVDLSEFHTDDDVVETLTNRWNDQEMMFIGINRVVKALGFKLSGELVHDVTFTIQ